MADSDTKLADASGDIKQISDRLKVEAAVQKRMSAHYNNAFQEFMLRSGLGGVDDIEKSLADMKHVSIIRIGNAGIEVRGAQFLLRADNGESQLDVKGTCFIEALKASIEDLSHTRLTLARDNKDLPENKGEVLNAQGASLFIPAQALKDIGMELPSLNYQEKAALSGMKGWLER
jgi:hypothetical protein